MGAGYSLFLFDQLRSLARREFLMILVYIFIN